MTKSRALALSLRAYNLEPRINAETAYYLARGGNHTSAATMHGSIVRTLERLHTGEGSAAAEGGLINGAHTRYIDRVLRVMEAHREARDAHTELTRREGPK